MVVLSEMVRSAKPPGSLLLAMDTATSSSPRQPLTVTSESRSFPTLPENRQGVSSPGMLLVGARRIMSVLFSSSWISMERSLSQTSCTSATSLISSGGGGTIIQLSECRLVMFCSSVHGRPRSKLQSLFVQLLPDCVHMQLLQSSAQLSPSSLVAPSMSTHWTPSPLKDLADEAKIDPAWSSSSSRSWQLTSPLLQEQSLMSPVTSMPDSSPSASPQASDHSSQVSRCCLRFPLSSTNSCSCLLTQNLRVHTGTPVEVHLQLLHSSFQESPMRRGFPSLSSPHCAVEVAAFVTLSVQDGLPLLHVHTFRSSPVFSSQVFPSEQVLPSSQLSWSVQILLVHPGVPLGRHRQLLQPSGLQESPTCLSLPSRSIPQPSPAWGLPPTNTAALPKRKTVVAHLNCISLSPYLFTQNLFLCVW